MAIVGDVYSGELTGEEKAAGFSLLEISNPKKDYMFQPKSVLAVVKTLSEKQRLIKIVEPDGSVRYAHQALIGAPRMEDDWRPVAEAAFTIEEAAIRSPVTDVQIRQKYGWMDKL